MLMTPFVSGPVTAAKLFWPQASLTAHSVLLEEPDVTTGLPDDEEEDEREDEEEDPTSLVELELCGAGEEEYDCGAGGEPPEE